MKKTLLLLTFIAALIAPLMAQVIVGRIDTPASTTLGWNPSTDPTVVGYYLFEGGQPGVYTNKVQVPGASSSIFTFNNLLHDTVYYYNIDAYNSSNVEGYYAGELTNWSKALPGAPSPLTVITNN